MPDPMHFDALADEYALARPPYPAALWQSIRDLGVLKPGSRALDLGAGTGQASGPLLEAGLRVTAVEPGARLAAHLRSSHPSASVIVARAEELDLPDRSFDLAVAATSIHWMDLDVLLPKLRRLLTIDGTLLVWRNVFGDPEAPVTPFRERVAQIVRERGEEPSPGADAEDLAEQSAALTRSGLFSVDDTFTFGWSIELDEQQVRRLFTTFSNWSPAEADRVAAATRELGGTVLEHYRSWLIVLSPTGGAQQYRGSSVSAGERVLGPPT